MKGTYTILLSCRRSVNVRFGKLGTERVQKGFYVYTGSALGKGAVSLEGRIKRHSRSCKRARWHVDYLTSNPSCEVCAVVYLRSRKRLECAITQTIVEKLNLSPILPHIGASDCQCKGHLMKTDSSFSASEILDRLREAYSSFGKRVVVNTDPRSFFPLPIASGMRHGRF